MKQDVGRRIVGARTSIDVDSTMKKGVVSGILVLGTENRQEVLARSSRAA